MDPPPILPTLLTLPWPVMETIMETFEIVDVLALSLVSPEATEIVKTHRKAFQRKIGWLQLESGKEHLEISMIGMGSNGTPVYPLLWTSKGDNLPSYQNLLYSPDYDCYGLGSIFGFRAKYPEEKILEGARLALEHIFSILGTSKHQVFLQPFSTSDFSENLLWKIMKKCDDVWIYEDYYFQLAVDGPNNYDFQEQLDLLFEKITIQKGFRIDVRPPTNCDLSRHFSKIRHLNFLRIESAPWMTDHYLEFLDCQCFFAENTRITNTGINRWLKKWMAGNSKRTSVLIIQSRRNISRDKVLKDLDSKPAEWRKEIDVRRFGTFIITCEDENTMLTRSDGSVARIRITEGCRMVEAHFSYNE